MLDISELNQIARNIVFRDLNIKIYSFSGTLHLYLERPCLDRDLDRKRPGDPPAPSVREAEGRYYLDERSRYENLDYSHYSMGPIRPYKNPTVNVMARWPIPECMNTQLEFISWTFDRILELERHEAEENFYFCGERIFDPHKASASVL